MAAEQPAATTAAPAATTAEDNHLSLWHSLSQLASVGIEAADLKRLQEAGYRTVEAIARATTKDLAGVKGFSERKVEKLLAAAHKMVKMGFATASTEMEARKKAIKITTGSKARGAFGHSTLLTDRPS